jgi:hypothetical protein
MYRYKIIVALLFSLIGSVRAQISTTNPFSSQGLGDVSFYGDAYFLGMGGITAALVDSTQTNLYNPSSYSLLAKGLPLFSMGVSGQQSNYNQNDAMSTSRYASITHMALAIPFANRFGLAFGLKPYSRAGYEINSSAVVDGDTIFYDYTGAGEIQEFNLGFAATIINNPSHTLSIGANGKHYFGRMSNRRMAYLKANQALIGSFQDDYLNVSSQGFDVGLTYKYRASERSQFTFGASFQPQHDLNVAKGSARVYFGNLANVSGYDTLVPYERNEGSVVLPQRLNVGLTYEFKQVSDTVKKRNKLPSYLISAEYGVSSWSQYEENIPSSAASPVFSDMTSLRLAFQFTPHRFANDRSTYIKFYDRMSYRVGGYSVALPYMQEGSQVQDVGISFGVGLPVVLNRAVSSINFSLSYGNRESDTPNSINEQYFGVGLGFNIAPSYDRWFRKYQLD